ncbi:MAG: HEAT repeat domain-containing protein [Verrucomicrobiales bacterium]|nr:HEAT repeat domain-containing protein [Verrucomicrobiales bacterium]
MHSIANPRLLLPLLSTLAGLALAGNLDAALRQREADGAATPDRSIAGRQYAPDRQVDMRHLALDITPDFRTRTIAATATLHFRPIANSLRTLRLDAVNLSIASVTSTAAIQGWQAEADALRVTFNPPLRPDEEQSVTITYTAEPEQGIYFRTPELGYRPEDTHLFSQGEAILGRHWYPCFDAPNEKLTSEITCHAPADMTVLSNGHLAGRSVDEAGGVQTVRWLQDKPHVNYLIALAVGYFEGIEDHWRDVPLTFHAPKSQAAMAANSFRDTRDMMDFFERETGVLYPWDRYGQVCVQDFVAGGMENTSLTILTDRTLFADEVGNLRSSQGLVAHELAHQWFGDLVTCKDWSHLWLNEGFATYYENLYDGYRNGRDAFLLDMHNDARNVLSQANDQTPIVNRTFHSPDDQFSFRAYPKGGWVLHMLRSQLGETLYRRAVRTYLERHAYDVVTTDDLRAVMEEVSGRSFDAFFDQWVYHAGTPILDVDYRWEEGEGLAHLTVRQTQKVTNNVLLFQVPLRFRFKADGMLEDRAVEIREEQHDFSFPLPQKPAAVRVDPDLELLAQVNFDPPAPMLHAQLEDEGDMLGRLLAVKALASRKDRETVQRLGRVLREDPFHAVRIEASKALRGIHSDEAAAALRAGFDQPDRRVQEQVIRDLRAFRDPASFAVLTRVFDTTDNPQLKREAILGLANQPQSGVDDRLLACLRVESFENLVAEAAIQALRTRDDARFVAPVQAALEERREAFRAGDYASALRTLAHLARHEEDRGAVREFLLAALDEPSPRVKRAAAAALGELGDPLAIPALETYVDTKGDGELAEAAKRAVADLKSKGTPDRELRDLRRELNELQRDNADLREELDHLKAAVRGLEGNGDEPEQR